ncbi:MAG: hypothetical protein KDA84_23920, partial [Planctomycetaceae bacterium]|nr:hypothetical protein [Planctomycetaceae bacterium]
PTFQYGCAQNPVFLNIYAKFFQQFGIHLPHAPNAGIYHQYRGDVSVSHKGEILIWQPAN